MFNIKRYKKMEKLYREKWKKRRNNYNNIKT